MVAALGWLGAAVLNFCWPVVYGAAIDTQTGQEVWYTVILDLKRVVIKVTGTDASSLILACPVAPVGKGELLAYRTHVYFGLPNVMLFKMGIRFAGPDYPSRTEIDPMALMAVENVADYLNDVDSQKYDGILHGFTAEGKAQLMRNMLEVLRRRRELLYLDVRVIPQLMRPLDHPAGPDEVPTAAQIIRKASQFF